MESNSNSSSSIRSSLGKQNILNTVIRVLLDCNDPNFRYWGKPVHTVNIVGRLKNLRVTAGTELSFDLEDHTGSIKAAYTANQEHEQFIGRLVEEPPCYCQVFAHFLNTDDNQKSLRVIKMYPENDVDKLICHLLKFISDRFDFEKARGQKIYNNALTRSALDCDFLVNYGNGDATQQQPPWEDRVKSLTTIQHEVYTIIKSEYGSVGISRTGVILQFPSYQEPEIMHAIDFLRNEGFIYATIDENHYKAVLE